ncbi:hypothetical protein BdWA1_002158 [Babesia duncani]|uniref:Uncharacterized protein n=1 Tax=Babesia duncani TaxID=323732 RepID=A0AAD9PLF5_9APIC|nr:hypothetical protein BdWA1_002158 [Babesia duncani]
MQADKTEDYEGVSVIRSAYTEGSYVYSHNITVSKLFFDMIKDESLTLVPKNKVRERHLFVLHVKGKVYLTYKRHSILRRFFHSKTKDVCLRKSNNKWKVIPCGVYKYLWSRYTLNMLCWDIAVKATFMEHKTMGNNIDFYYPKEGVFIFHILHSGKLIWSAYDTSFKRFNNLFIMQQNGMTYVVIVYSKENRTTYTVLVKREQGWLPLPPIIAKPVIFFFKDIGIVLNPHVELRNPYNVELPEYVEAKVRGYFNNVLGKQIKPVVKLTDRRGLNRQKIRSYG